MMPSPDPRRSGHRDAGHRASGHRASEPIILAPPGNEALADALLRTLGITVGAEVGTATVRHFPDGESYVRIESPVRDRAVILACTLDHPDAKLLPLLFLAATAAELGARTVGLVAPYLAYMRQDRRFQPGEGITSAYFARVLSNGLDWLVTVDPHLHRRSSLAEIYSIPTTVIHAAPAISDWIRKHVERPVLVGPDEESAQWVRAVADAAGAPSIVLRKERRGDRDVRVTIPDVARWRTYTPVLVDDIISTARTMIETATHLTEAGLIPPVCIGVHGIFAGRAADELAAVAGRVVTCDTIPHPTNAVDVLTALGEAAGELIRSTPPRVLPSPPSPASLISPR